MAIPASNAPAVKTVSITNVHHPALPAVLAAKKRPVIVQARAVWDLLSLPIVQLEVAMVPNAQNALPVVPLAKRRYVTLQVSRQSLLAQAGNATVRSVLRHALPVVPLAKRRYVTLQVSRQSLLAQAGNVMVKSVPTLVRLAVPAAKTTCDAAGKTTVTDCPSGKCNGKECADPCTPSCNNGVKLTCESTGPKLTDCPDKKCNSAWKDCDSATPSSGVTIVNNVGNPSSSTGNAQQSGSPSTSAGSTGSTGAASSGSGSTGCISSTYELKSRGSYLCTPFTPNSVDICEQKSGASNDGWKCAILAPQKIFQTRYPCFAKISA